MSPPKVSIIIPVKDEAESISILGEKLITVIRQIQSSRPEMTFQVIWIDDGSVDHTAKELRLLTEKTNYFESVIFRKNFGKSAALAEGFSRAKGEILITMDGDLQDDPEAIPALIDTLDSGYDLVSCWKKDRKDRFEKRFMSKIFNAVLHRVTGIRLHDFNSGFKAYKSWCLKNVNLSGNLYRFLPVFVARQGGKITELPVKHYPRQFGASKYGPMRYFHGAFDLITMLFLFRFLNSPMYFFAFAALPLIAIGTIILIILLIGHIQYLMNGDLSLAMNSRPLLIGSIAMIGFGVNFILVGALAEFILQLWGNTRNQRMYTIETVIKPKT